MSLTNEAKVEVQRLLQNGQKIKAIKYICDTFGVSLTDGKALVETIQDEMQENATARGIDHELKEEVLKLIKEQSKIEAIKFVKEWLDVSLSEAHRIVTDIEEENSPTARLTSTVISDRKPFLLFVRIFGGIGILLVGIALTITYFKQKSISNSDLVVGKVIDLVGSGTVAPVVKFNYLGAERTYQSSVYSSPPAYDIGEEVELFVNREDIDDILINSFIDRWLAATIVGGIGLFFLDLRFCSVLLAANFDISKVFDFLAANFRMTKTIIIAIHHHHHVNHMRGGSMY